MTQTITLRHTVERPSGPPVHTEATVQVMERLEAFGVLVGRELARYCYVEGYRDMGRDIGARNPYDKAGGWRSNPFPAEEGAHNSYALGPAAWQEEAPRADSERSEEVEA